MRKYAIAVIGLLIIGLLIRFVGLQSIPPGLWSDEANHGLEANDIVAGARIPLFFPGNCGQEPLFKYMITALTCLLGPGVATLRLASAISGWLLLPLAWVWLKRHRGAKQAAIALFFLVFGVWHIQFSRIAFRAILGPSLGLLSLLAVDFYQRRGSVVWGGVAGVCAGLLWYIYPAFRLFPLITLLWLFLLSREEKGRRSRAAVPFLVGFVLCLLPLVLAWRANPELLTARASMAAIWNETGDLIPGLVRNTWRHIGMFTVSGDNNWRHNLSGAPQLDMITGFFFLVGLIVAVSRRHRVDFLLLSWLALMLVPGILSVERQAPHCLRTLGVLPVPYLLAADGVMWFDRGRGGAKTKRLLFVCILVLVPALTLGRYFVQWPAELNKLTVAEESLFGFNRQEYHLGKWLTQRKDGTRVWFSPQLFLHPTTAYMAREAEYGLLCNPSDLVESDLVVLQPVQRNLWWMRDDFRKNFFLWWWTNGRVTEEETWSALMWAYPICGQGMSDGSDRTILDSLRREWELKRHSEIAGLTVMQVCSAADSSEVRNIRPLDQWRRLPSGCFTVTLDSIPEEAEGVVLVAKEEESTQTWILDRSDGDLDPPILLSGCFLFPACARVEAVGSEGHALAWYSGEWSFSGPADTEPYFRSTSWGKARAFWARFRARSGL